MVKTKLRSHKQIELFILNIKNFLKNNILITNKKQGLNHL